MTSPSKAPLPLCACGCGRRVNYRTCRYASHDCVPRSLRVAGALKGARTRAFRGRATAFAGELATLGQTMTREALLAAFRSIDQRAYNRGWKAAKTAPELGATEWALNRRRHA